MTYEPIDRLEVFERDGWRCGICRKPVDQAIQWPDHRAPSLDHIVPLSRGGSHTYPNVQCAHIGCNWTKNDRIGSHGDQLRLIG